MAKRNSDYWKKRFAALEEDQYQYSARYYRDVQKQFQEASNSIQMDIGRWYQRLADNNGISYAGAKKFLKSSELDEFKWSVEQYIKAGEENAVDGRWMRELENASARYHISYLEAMKLQTQQHAELLSVQFEQGITEFLHKSYGDGFYHTAHEIARGTGVGVSLSELDPKKLEVIVKKPWAQDKENFSNRIWTNKEKLVNALHTELSQNIIRGASPSTAIGNLAKTMDVGKRQAGRLVMTESAAIASASRRDCLNELGIEQYEILATLDSHTSKICQELDGKVFDMKNYEVGISAPPFHPHCRSTAIPYFDDEFSGAGERAARDAKTGETYYVPANTTYEDWQKSFAKNQTGIAHADDSGIIKAIRIPKEAFSARNITPDIIENIQSGIDEIMNEYDVKINRILPEDISSRLPGVPYMIRFVDNDGLKEVEFIINAGYDFSDFERIVKDGYECGYFAGKTVKDHAMHEMAHAMTGQQYRTTSGFNDFASRMEKQYVPGVSGYSDNVKDGFETVAEAFVRMRNGETVPEEAKKLVEKHIERWKK